jgi:hypothetical protein
MAGQKGGWSGTDFDDFDTKHEAWLAKLVREGVDLDAFAQEVADS